MPQRTHFLCAALLFFDLLELFVFKMFLVLLLNHRCHVLPSLHLSKLFLPEILWFAPPVSICILDHDHLGKKPNHTPPDKEATGNRFDHSSSLSQHLIPELATQSVSACNTLNM